MIPEQVQSITAVGSDLEALATPPPRAIATGLIATSDTVQDWLAASQAPVPDGDLTERFVLLDGPGRSELLTVNGDGKLLHIKPTNDLDDRRFAADLLSEDVLAAVESADRSDGGWTSKTIKLPDSREVDHRHPRGVVSALRGVSIAGRTVALVQFDGRGGNAVKHRYVELIAYDRGSDTWAPITVEGEQGLLLSGSVQSRIRVTDDNQTFIYARNTSLSAENETISMVFWNDKKAAWGSLLVRFPKAPTGRRYTYRIIGNARTDSFGTLLRFGEGGTVHSKVLILDPGTPRRAPSITCIPKDADDWVARDLSALVSNLGVLSDCRFVPLPKRPDTFCVQAEKDGKLYLVTDFASSPQVTCLSEEQDKIESARMVRAGLDHRPANGDAPQILLVAVAEGAGSALWVKREIAGQPGRFHPWNCLGDVTRTFALPQHMHNGAELFVASDDRKSIEHLSLDASGQSWHTQVLETAKASAEQEKDQCSIHSTKLLLTTKDDLPAHKAAVGVSADHPCVVVINGVARHLTPSHPVTAVADDCGELLIKCKAESLHAPVYTLHFPGGSTRGVRGDQAVIRRLSGKEAHEPINADRLQTRGLIPKDDRLGVAARRQFAAMARDTAFAMGQRRAGIGQSGESLVDDADVRCYAGVFKPGSAKSTGAWSMAFGRGRGAARRISQINRSKPLVDYNQQGALSGGVFGDIWRWIKRTAQKAIAFLVEIGRGVVAFTLELGNRVIKLTLATVNGIAEGMSALFQAVGRAVEFVVDAAKKLAAVVTALFAIDSIRRTNDVLGHLLTSGLAFVEAFVGDDLPLLTKEMIDTIAALFDRFLAQAQKLLEGTTPGSAAKGLPENEQGKSGQAGRRDLLNKCSVQATWVTDRARDRSDVFDDSVDATFSNSAANSRVGAALKKLMQLIVDLDDVTKDGTLVGTGAQVIKTLADLFKNGPSTTSLVKLIGALRSFVKLVAGLLQTSLELIFGIVADALKALNELLSADLDIPGINQLCQAVLKRKLKIRDLLTLGLSVAGTLLWKVCNKGTEPFDAATAERILKTGIYNKETRSALLAFLRFKLGKASKDDEKTLTAYARNVKEIALFLQPVGVIARFVHYLNAAFVVMPLQVARTALNMAAFPNPVATKLGYLQKVFGLVGFVMSLSEVWLGTVRDVTRHFLPDSAEARLWKAQRAKGILPPTAWFSITTAMSMFFTLTSLVCTKSMGVAGAWANLGLNVFYGGFVILAAIVNLGYYLATNTGVIRPWAVVAEIGGFLGTIPSVLYFVVPFVALAPGPLQAPAKIVGGAYLLLQGSLMTVSALTSLASTIDQNIAKQWSDFSGKPPSLLEAV